MTKSQRFDLWRMIVYSRLESMLGRLNWPLTLWVHRLDKHIVVPVIAPLVRLFGVEKFYLGRHVDVRLMRLESWAHAGWFNICYVKKGG